MKILSINRTDVTQIGGVNYSIKRISEELVKRGHECYVVSINPGNMPNEDRINDVNILRVRSFMGNHVYGLSFSMGRFLSINIGKFLNPDIVHIHEYRSLLTLEVAYLLRVKRLPFVFSPHFDRLGYNTFAGKHLLGFYKPFGTMAFKWAEKMIANSEYTKDMLSTDFSVPPSKIEVIPHGVDDLEISEGRTKKATGDMISLLYAGVLIKLKGIQYIIQALAELKRSRKQATLTIVGRGDYEHELRKLADIFGIEDNIIWHRPVFGDELRRKLREADIFVLLSRSEGYGIVVAEALAAGTPCIVTKTTALKEFLTEPGCFGIDYPPNPVELADMILRIHDSEIKVGPFSNKIRTWDKVAIDYERLYESAIRHASG